MFKRVLTIPAILIAAELIYAQIPTPTATAVGPWRTGVPVHCPDGRTIPANTVISGPNVTPEELCGSKSASSETSSTGVAMVSNTGNLKQDLLTNSVNLMIVSKTTNPYVSQFMQSAATSFISSMFANNAEAARQRAIMEQQILERQREAERQRRIAEQRRFDAMYARLSAALKLEGVPLALSLKNMDSGGPDSLQLKGMKSGNPDELHLKIGEARPTAYGLKGLPGIYVGGPAGGDETATTASAGSSEAAGNPNLVNGPGTGTTGPGIPGLPGVYLDNAQPAQAPQLAQAAQTMDGPERSFTEDSAIHAAEKNSALTGPSQDPNVQNFQQADKDYQQALVENANSAQQLEQAQHHVESDKGAIEVARTQLASITPSVEQQQKFDQMLAAAKTDEDAAALARQNFDNTNVHLGLARDRASASLAALAPSPVTVATNDASVVDLSRSAHTQPALLRAPTQPLPAVRAPIQVPSPVVTPAPVARRNSSDPAMNRLCSQLDGAQDALRRLMETQKMQNENREDWEKIVDSASDDALTRGLDMTREVMGGAFQDRVKNLIKKDDAEIENLYHDISSEKDPLKVGTMQKRWEELDLKKANLQDALQRSEKYYKHLDELAGERDLYGWIKESNSDLPSFMDGVRQLADHLLADDAVKGALRLSPDGADYIKYSASIIDSGYDIYSEWLAAKQIKQLNHSAEQYLHAVDSLQTRIRKTVTQLNQYKAENPTGARCSEN